MAGEESARDRDQWLARGALRPRRRWGKLEEGPVMLCRRGNGRHRCGEGASVLPEMCRTTLELEKKTSGGSPGAVEVLRAHREKEERRGDQMVAPQPCPKAKRPRMVYGATIGRTERRSQVATAN